jgi:hypothetical protein
VAKGFDNLAIFWGLVWFFDIVSDGAKVEGYEDVQGP